MIVVHNYDASAGAQKPAPPCQLSKPPLLVAGMGKRKTTAGGLPAASHASDSTAPTQRRAAPVGSRDVVPGLGERVAARRKEMGLTLREAGQRWDIRFQKLNLIENFARRRSSDRFASGGISAPTLIKLALGGGTSIDFLCGLTSNPTPNWDLVHNAPPPPAPPTPARETKRPKAPRAKTAKAKSGTRRRL